MQQNLFLAFFGGILGLALLFALRPVIEPLLTASHEATHFESVEDLHRKMLERDNRDLKGDRSVSLRSIITPHTNESIIFDLLPHLEVKFQGVPVRTNSCGFRGREHALAKPSDVTRVLFLGDSFTFGWGVEEDESFPSVTEEILNRYLTVQDYPAQDRTVEVLNLGIPGYSTFQQAEYFFEKGLDFQPDIVVLFFVENDFGLPFFIGDVKKGGEVMSSTKFAAIVGERSESEYNEAHDKLVAQLDPNRALQRLHEGGKEHGYELFLAFNPHPDWKTSLQRLWYARQNSGVQIVKLRKRFLDAMDSFGIAEAELSLHNDPHPSAVKHALLGTLIAESLLPALERT